MACLLLKTAAVVGNMGWNDHVDFDLHEAITDLVDEGMLEEGTPAYGVAQQVIDRGYGSLTLKQRAVYDAVVVPALKRRAEQLEDLRHDPYRGKMRLELALLGGAALITASIALTNHYEMGMRPEGGFFRLNRWTGEIAACMPELPPPKGSDPAWKKESTVVREFQTVCNP